MCANQTNTNLDIQNKMEIKNKCKLKKTNGNNREFSMQCNMNTDQVQIEPLHILLYALIEQHCYNRNSHCGKLFFPAFTYLSECTKHRLGLFEQNLSNCATQMLLPSSTWATNLQFVSEKGPLQRRLH